MKTYGVIMAGGGGTRFWPLSTKAEPKQFLNLSGKDILVNETIDRQHDLMDQKDIFIVTNETQAKMMKERTAGRIAADHILAEPAARNTAACIGYAAMEILHKYGDGVMCIFAADAYIRDEAEYTRVMKEAVRAVEETDALVTIGIHPTFPSTGYGYIRSVEEAGKVWRKVEEFVEKLAGLLILFYPPVAGFGNGEKLSGIRQLCVEQRHVCLESLHDSSLFRRTSAGCVRLSETDRGSARHRKRAGGSA